MTTTARSTITTARRKDPAAVPRGWFLARVWLAIGLVVLSTGCGDDSDKRRQAGYDDGYAVGFNTACEIRSTMVEGDWDDREYSKGYAEGQTAGIVACNQERASNE